MSLKLNTLYFFSAIAESDSFQEAAERLFITQQALSKALMQLEQDVGQPLLYRNQRGKQRLTPAGKLLYQKSQSLIASVFKMEDLFQEQRANVTSIKIRIGFLHLFDLTVANWVEQWQIQNPSHQPEFKLFQSPVKMARALLQGHLDLGVFSEPPDGPDFTAVEMCAIPYQIMGAAHFQGKPWHELPYICFAPEPEHGGTFNVWPETKWPRKIIAELDIAMATHLCLLGVGCLHMPMLVLPYSDLKQTVQPIVQAPFEIFAKRYLVWPSTRPLEQPLNDFSQALLASLTD
jgi:DNA-binding transcriptional LysR family regulator